jgi:hypothetical protein
LVGNPRSPRQHQNASRPQLKQIPNLLADACSAGDNEATDGVMAWDEGRRER